jgi:hypothetical protein
VPHPAANHNQADFAVVLLDVNMSSMDGIATARLIRQREGSRKVTFMPHRRGAAASEPFRECSEKKPVDFSTGFFVARCLQATMCYAYKARFRGSDYGSTGVRTPFTSVRTPANVPGETESAVEPRTTRSWMTELLCPNAVW